MTKLMHSLFAVAFATFLFSFLPTFASAQQVHEVRPAGADHVRIGVHGPASMETVVAFARRITGNSALTAEDVIANLPHARRYACRVGGRLVYFGPDPGHGGRCPADGVRTEGVLRGAVYRIPREHGVVLESPVERRARRATPPASDEASQRRIAELESRLAAVTTERDEARAALSARAEHDRGAEILADEERRSLEAERDTARRERDEARTALASRPATPTIVSVGAPGEREENARLAAEAERLREENARLTRELEAARHDEVTFESRIDGRPIWGLMALLALVILAIAFIAFGLVVLPREKRPLIRRIDELEEAKTKVEGEFMAKNVEAKEADEALGKAQRRIASLRAAGTRAIRMGRRLFEEGRASAEAHRALKEDEERAATKLIEYQNRKECIAENHAKLMKLREEEDPFLHLETLIRQTETDRELAVERGDAKTVGEADQALAIYRENLESLGDASELRARIAGLTALLARDVQLQCGVAFDTRSADERLAAWEDLRRGELRETAAERKRYETLISLLEERELGRVAEATAKRKAVEGEFAGKEGALFGKYMGAALMNQEITNEMHELREELDEHKRLVDAFAGDPSAHAQAILQRDGVIADFAKRLREAGIDPGKLPVTPSNGSWPEEITEELPLPGGTPAYGARAPRKRVPTLMVGASEEAVRVARDSQLPAPPKSPTYALNHAVSRLLDELEVLPVDARIVHADDRDAAEWTRLLGLCAISAPSIGEVPFRKLLAVVERRVPEWLTERRRRRTDPPPAPSMA